MRDAPDAPSVQTVPSPHHPHRGQHQAESLGVGLVVALLVALAVTGLVVSIFLYWLFGVFDRQEKAQQVPLTSIQQPGPQTPEPRLQGIPTYHATSPAEDRVQMQARNSHILTTYGPSPEDGYARIPIDRAMDLVVEKNLLTPQSQSKGGKR